MKITSFNPMVASPKAEDIISLFEALGFEKRHEKKEVNDTVGSHIRMTDPNGNHFDVGSAPLLPHDRMMIRMNVDDFEEASALLAAHGFTVEKTAETESSKSAALVSPSGFSILLIQHYK